MCVSIYSLEAHDRGSFEVFGLGLFLWDNLSCLWACWVRTAQILSTSLQDAVLGSLSKYPGFMGCKISQCTTAHLLRHSDHRSAMQAFLVHLLLEGSLSVWVLKVNNLHFNTFIFVY